MKAKNWLTEEYTGDCDHRASTKDGNTHGYGTAYCPTCGASRGPDGKWRVQVEVK